MVKITLTNVEQTLNRLKEIGSDKKLDEIIAKSTHYAHKQTLKGAKPHRRSGNMEDNISMRIHKATHTGIVKIEDTNMMVSWRGKRVNYATFVLFGAKPHWIYPNKRKTLRKTKGGSFKYAKAVHHPGYKGDDFIYRAAQNTFKELETIAKEVIDGLL